MLQKYIRKLKKAYHLGPRECIRILCNRMMIRRFAKQNKSLAIAKKAATTWDVFIKTHPTFVVKYDFFFLDALIAHVDHKDIIKHAHNALQNKMLLFEQEIFFEGDARWHTDFLLQRENSIDCLFDPEIYFADVIITTGKDAERVKDIRVVWELSRLHLLMPLGKAYLLTQDQRFIVYFKQFINDWYDKNPFLIGVNWACPMEVGIRAINLIVGLMYFKDALLDETFSQRYVCLLYDHMRYLECTWEYYDGRTSNHYLSDLIGYFYLLHFFRQLSGIEKKIDWVVAEILAEYDKQILQDGMSYEGSTSYHVLVAELYSLFKLLCEQEGIALPETFYQKFEHMCQAVKACKINAHEMIRIGDNDSGKILWAGFSCESFLKTQTNLPQERTNYAQFGLSIIQKEGWHVSFRHHRYTLNQPSGHFHNDFGSITLALHETSILIDPGTYCYTASAFWRNYFRSTTIHNLVSVKDSEPVKFDDRLFALNIPENATMIKTSQKSISSTHILYEHEKLKFVREVEVQKNAITITDSCEQLASCTEDIVLFFNFTFAPGIELQKFDNDWLISKNGEPICLLQVNLIFKEDIGYVSHNYGSKYTAKRLCAETLYCPNMVYVCRFVKIE